MRRHPSRLPAVRFLAAVAAVAAALTLSPAGAASSKTGAAISPSYFGVHHLALRASGTTGWPQAPVGSIRLWDNGVSWRELETAPGVFTWDVLDAHVAKARAAGASVLLVLGQTPEFHSSRPAAPGFYGAGASAMPGSKQVWVRYVQEVARRNRTVWGGVVDFQVWNEANVSGYWSGTPTQMATLTAWTDEALRAVDPSATLVGPALVTRLSSQRQWIDAFFGRRVAGRRVGTYVDAVSLQLYPEAGGSPEASMRLLATVRRTLKRHHVTKPIWNTEVNYGLVGGTTPGAAARQVSQDRQVANVIRTYVLNAQNGVARVYWYSWDLLGLSNTPMVASDRTTLTAAGSAFAATRRALVGARPAGCAQRRGGAYRCVFVKGGRKLVVNWNPKSTVTRTSPGGLFSAS